MNRRAFIAGAVAATAARPSAALAFSARPQAAHSFSLGEEEFLLTDILSPVIRAGTAGEPFARQALAAQQSLLAAGEIDVSAMQARDRWGRRSGVAVIRLGRAEPSSLQLLLVRAGAARVAPSSDAFEFIGMLLAAEDEARRAGRGLWSASFYDPIDANSCCQRLSPRFHIARGVIVTSALRSGRIYLNFGDDYRTDFTASIPARAMKGWRSPIAPETIGGAMVEIRGHVDFYNGPSVELTHEMQVRFLEGSKQTP